MKQDFPRGEALFLRLTDLPPAMLEEAASYTAAEKDARIRRMSALAAAFLLFIGLGTAALLRPADPDTPNYGPNSQGYFNAEVLSIDGNTVLVRVTDGFDAAEEGAVMELNTDAVAPLGTPAAMGLTAGEEVRVVFNAASLTEENGTVRIGTVFSLFRVVDGVVQPHETAHTGTEGLSPDELPDAAYDITPDEPLPDAPVVSLSAVVFNENVSILSGALRYFDPDKYTTERWQAVELEAYYGRSLVPAYTPAGFTRTGEAAAQVITENATGTTVHDTVHLTWKGEGDAAYTVSFARVGLLSCGIYQTEDGTDTDIGGIPVRFGYCLMPEGPYDPVTKEPASHYPLYTADFTINGTRYAIVTERMEQSEIVQIAASVIYGEICRVVE